jgi:hypothetical protein
MQVNALPSYDTRVTPTGCCPKFSPEVWDEQTLHFKDKLFVRVSTLSIFHIPINIDSVFRKTTAAIEQAGALDEVNFIVLSTDVSAWHSEHYFSVAKDVPGQEMLHMTGDYYTKVFEGPYRKVKVWETEMSDLVNRKGKQLKKTYFFYTTCPKCAKFYGKNYVVAISQFVK